MSIIDKINKFSEQMKSYEGLSSVKAAEEYAIKVSKENQPSQKRTFFDKILDFLAQPVSVNAKTEEEAKADAIIIEAYWRAKGGSSKTEVHQHLHVHQGKDGNFKE